MQMLAWTMPQRIDDDKKWWTMIIGLMDCTTPWIVVDNMCALGCAHAWATPAHPCVWAKIGLGHMHWVVLVWLREWVWVVLSASQHACEAMAMQATYVKAYEPFFMLDSS